VNAPSDDQGTQDDGSDEWEAYDLEDFEDEDAPASQDNPNPAEQLDPKVEPNPDD
jgi:hypothetical protein